jgi:protein-S-isoprenylcysteine O-methyltransferase Ste14
LLARDAGMAKLDHNDRVLWPIHGSAPTASEDAGRALRSAHPTLLWVLLAGFALANAVWFHVLEEVQTVPSLVSGAAVVFIGMRFILQGRAAFRRSGTPVLPYKPSLTLVTGDIFGQTRNPMYQGLGIVVLGLALLLRNDGVMALPFLLAPVIHHGLVLPEERYLERRFGHDYVRFTKLVPRYRWLLWPSAGERPLAKDWLTWTIAAAGLVLAAYVIPWLADLGTQAVEEPGVRTAVLARAPVFGRASLLAAARDAGLRRSPEVKVASILSRTDDGRVRVDGWAAEIGGNGEPLTVLVFTEGFLALETKTRGERPDLPQDMKLSAEAARNVAFEGILTCRPRQRLVIVAVTLGNKYALLPTLICP